MIPGGTLALAAIAQRTYDEMRSVFPSRPHRKDCMVCADMVYVSFFNWLTRQRGRSTR